MKVFDRENWNKVYQTIYEQAKLYNKLVEIIKARGYSPSAIKDEIPSTLLEWAVTQKEFLAGVIQ